MSNAHQGDFIALSGFQGTTPRGVHDSLPANEHGLMGSWEVRRSDLVDDQSVNLIPSARQAKSLKLNLVMPTFPI